VAQIATVATPSILEPCAIEVAILLVGLHEENHWTYVLIVGSVHRVEAWPTDRDGTRDQGPE